MMVMTQYLSAKIALVTGMGLAGVVRHHYSRFILYTVIGSLVIANTINAGADIGAIAAAINLIVPIPSAALIVPIALVILAMQIWGSYRLIATVFKWLTLALFAYIGASFLAHPSLPEVVRGTFIPSVKLDAKSLAILVAVLGTTVSPYMWFWQASQEIEEKVAHGRRALWQRKGTTTTELRYAAWDVNVGMAFSNVVMYFILLGTAATLFKAGNTDIRSAAEAAEALRPVAGNGARLLFALGLIGTGFLAVPVLTGAAAYAMGEAFGWKSSLDAKLYRAKPFYAAIAASTLVGMLINFVGINPIDALVWTAVIFGFLTPPLLILLLLIGNNRRIMDKRVNSLWLNVVGWATVTVMTAAIIGMLATWGKS
jgi:NRAMP (natural resistance-associated macrophage protein)-like metal ion transporter